MTSKMTARHLFYAPGPSYGNSKGAKLKKVHEEDRLSFFKPGLWRAGFSNVAKNGNHFLQELMVIIIVV